MSIDLQCNWHYRKDHWPHVSDGGSADISIGSSTITATMALSNSNGKPAVTASGCAIQIGSFSLKLHGGASWLYNLCAVRETQVSF